MLTKRITIHISVLVFACFLVACNLYAFNKEDYLKLMTTNECRGCDLTRLDLPISSFRTQE